MEKFIEFLTWQNFFTGAGFVFGIITLIAYLDQKSTNKKQSEILDFVKNENNKQAIIELEKTKINLESEINEKIPGLGKRAILEEQMEFYEKIVAENYNELKNIKLKLDNDSLNRENLSPTIKNYVLSDLYPKYYSNELKNKTRDRIIIFIALVVLFGTLLPFGFGAYLIIPFGFYLIYEVLKLSILNSDSNEIHNKIFKTVLFILRIALLIILFFSIYFLVSEFSQIKQEIKASHVIISIFAIIGIVIFTLSSSIINRVRKSISKELEGSI
ncbi:hypothetical protein [Flavivirga rizhaonensis]|uniref:Uncharacterized protein n=1 Tax=Flavivirga rizhaonensis TaxID=2559571 RepID=A0A4S1E152_9FLAO|nr:hypothetical protein [Flavivirga rizhaonensis]TGV03622.1 hypothetical protein EM932_06245 [Flavivirga rizhaonensis]